MTLPVLALRLYHYPAYLASWAAFAVGGLAINAFCAPLLLASNRARHGPLVRSAIRRMFVAWCAWLHVTRLVRVRFRGFTPEAMKGPAVYVANHPGLLDATFILSRLHDTICIFKPGVMRNPLLGPAALMGGYAAGDGGADLIREAAVRVADGRSLLVFPEGTRTVRGVDLNPLRPGFALIAERAQVPVRIILVRAPRDLLPKGRPWWRPPVLPATVDVVLWREINFAPGEEALELTDRVTREISSALAA